MIELTSFTPQLQAAHWGWTIAIFLWLVGLAGMGFFLNYWIRQKNFVSSDGFRHSRNALSGQPLG